MPGSVRFVLDEGICMLLLLVDARPLSCQAASFPYLIGAWREVNSSLMADFSIKLLRIGLEILILLRFYKTDFDAVCFELISELSLLK